MFEMKDAIYYRHVAVVESLKSIRHDYKRMLAEIKVLELEMERKRTWNAMK